MTTPIPVLDRLSDGDLLAQVQAAARDERRVTTHLITLLMELDARKLYLGEGCSSLFTYCTQVLHLSEHAAYGRIEAARAGRKFPVLLTRLTEGALTLTAVGLLAPHLTPENHVAVIDSACHRSKREIEQLVARLRPLPDVPALVRKLPTPETVPASHGAACAQSSAIRMGPPDAGAVDMPTAESGVPLTESPTLTVALPPAARTRGAEVKPLAPERYKIQFTVGRETYEELLRAQDLLRHSIPNGDPAAIFTRALSVLLKELSKTKLAVTHRPRPAREIAHRSRHIPAAVRRVVWQRDGGRCAFTGAQGRCAETGFLEFHHVVPHAAGGETSVANVQLRCRAHNAFEAEQDFWKLTSLGCDEGDESGMDGN